MDQNIISALVMVSEKAANIARIIRKNQNLLSLLVQEKKENEKNPRFIQDFKTFADVLVQEVVKYELVKKFPLLDGNIFGEENNEFKKGGANIIVEVKENVEKTEELLSAVLGDTVAASLLTNEVHRVLDMDNSFENLSINLPENVAIWIDPIDSTAEYISGGSREVSPGLFSGLPCVTVLIGVFDKETGVPIAGVINQPFHEEKEGLWTGEYVYGISLSNLKHSGPKCYPKCCEKVVAVSSSESRELKELLHENGYKIVEVAGAGYKLLSIITGQICGYVLSKPTTFFWDTCACHAILDSLGGGLIDLTTREPVLYRAGIGTKECCNSGGIIAYREPQIKDDLIRIVDYFQLVRD